MTLTPDELELVTTAYARVAAAYQDVGGQRLSRPPTMSPPIEVVARIGDSPIDPARAMAPRALLHYRKAELGLRRGDLTGAVLQLKMAIASDPRSPFLRSALAEVESELRKKP